MTASERCTAFDPFEFETRWVAWRNEVRNGKQTKVPYSPHGGPAKADDPSTWSTRSAAEAKARNLANGEDGGIGIELGDLGDGTSLGGIDLDTCLFGGMFEQWAMDIIQRLGSYAEVSPSGTGAKILFRYLTEDLPKLRAEMGGAQHGKMFKRPNGLDHPPAIELHLTNRYFATTEQRLGWTPDRIITVPTEHLLWVLKEAGPAFAGTAFAGGRSKAGGNSDKSRSATAFRKGCALRRAGKTFEEMVEALRADPETAAWCREKGDANGGRELQRIWDKAGVAEEAAGVTLTDFHAYMPMHNYIFIPTRALWPASSVNARIPPIPLFNANGTPRLDDKGKPVKISASIWLDQNQPVEQMTWAPGLPELIEGRLLYEGGWLERPGARCFNQYLAPTIVPGDARRADRWLDHVRLIYPDDAEHLICWLAHRVQRPHEKINHAIVLGGEQGVGKDTLLEPVKHAIGAWNFQEASPQQVLGRFNGFLKAVILRISEARDLGEFDRFKFYDHMKAHTAAPPDTLRVDEKHLREYAILNVCGVIITTNHKTDGIYLPADDRRHYVAWSDKARADPEFQNRYWAGLYAWFHDGGMRHVAAFLAQYDIRGFDPKAPPPKTAAFWAIADSYRPTEESELNDALDLMRRPDAFTLAMLVRALENQPQYDGGFVDWLNDRKNRRAIPHRLERCGCAPVRNPYAEDGLWKVKNRRQVVYARKTLALRDQIAAAQALCDDR